MFKLGIIGLFSGIIALLAIFYTDIVIDCQAIFNGEKSDNSIENDVVTPKSIYDLEYTDIKGNKVSMEKYRGFVTIIVNVASSCGFTDVNYKELSELYEKYYESKGLRIIGFPSNQFMQEGGSKEDICALTKTKYNIKFDLSDKVTLNGRNTHPIIKFVKDSYDNGIYGSLIKWNFTKFIIDKKGNVVKRFGPSDNPSSMEKDLLHYFGQK